VHVPEGGAPKDGPSAGLVLAAAMLLALSGVPVKVRVTMTGEIMLGDRILRVGGLKEKLLAASRSGIRTMLLPGSHRGTIAEVPPEVVGRLKLVYVDKFEARCRTCSAGAERPPRASASPHGPPSPDTPAPPWGTFKLTLIDICLQGARKMSGEHNHQTPGSDLEPAVDADGGQLEKHCSQCGVGIEGSDEFCQVCAVEASGSDVPPTEDAR